MTGYAKQSIFFLLRDGLLRFARMTGNGCRPHYVFTWISTGYAADIPRPQRYINPARQHLRALADQGLDAMAKWSLEELNGYIGRAEAGDIEAQLFLGWAYLAGKTVGKNDRLAEQWLRRASNQGSREATFRLAVLLVVSRKDTNGIEMLKRLSAANFAPAAYELGNFYYVGMSVERDVGAAELEWSRAANGGHALARTKLIKCESLRSPFYKKPFLFFKLSWAVLSTVSILLRDFDDQRTLGSIR